MLEAARDFAEKGCEFAIFKFLELQKEDHEAFINFIKFYLNKGSIAPVYHLVPLFIE